MPNTTIRINNACQFVHVPFISTVLPNVEIDDRPSWISTTSQAPMTLVVGANKAEDASERNAQVIYTYTDPRELNIPAVSASTRARRKTSNSVRL